MAMRNLRHTPVRRDTPQSTTDQEQEGIVVWDYKGIVVVWPDGHGSRFSWAVLRQVCPCPVCREQRVEHELRPKD
jgi:DUF971 family protein